MNKAEIIGEIEAIYRDLGHEPRGRLLEEFSEEQLLTHLANLVGGEHLWMAHGRKLSGEIRFPETIKPGYAL